MRKKLSEMTISELDKKIKSEKTISTFLTIIWIVFSALFLIIDVWVYSTLRAESVAVIALVGLGFMAQILIVFITETEKRFRLLERS